MNGYFFTNTDFFCEYNQDTIVLDYYIRENNANCLMKIYYMGNIISIKNLT